MKTILLILGSENGPISKGGFNRALFDTAKETLAPSYNILTTITGDVYDIEEEAEKFRQADSVIWQFPIFWFMPPAGLKKYLDTVYRRGVFYGRVTPYGTGGRMTQKTFMLSTTWNAPPEAFKAAGTFYEGLSVDDANIAMRQAQRYIGMTELPHFSCHNVVMEPDLAADKARFVAHLSKVYGVNATS